MRRPDVRDLAVPAQALPVTACRLKAARRNAELPRQDLGISSRSPGSTNAAVERREARAPSLLPEQAEGNEGARDASLGVPACRVMARLGAAFRTSASRRSAPSSGHGMKAKPAPQRSDTTCRNGEA